LATAVGIWGRQGGIAAAVLSLQLFELSWMIGATNMIGFDKNEAKDISRQLHQHLAKARSASTKEQMAAEYEAVIEILVHNIKCLAGATMPWKEGE